MRPKTGVVLLILITFALGCPNPAGFKFTSADFDTGGLLDVLGALNTAVDGTTEDGSGESEVEREVVEPDVIRRDGNLLYILNQYRGLVIADLDTQAIRAQVPAYGYPRDIYLAGDRAYVLVGYARDYTVEDGVIAFTVRARLHVVDISQPDQAHIIGSFPLYGDLVDSRLVGDVIYAVCAEYSWYLLDGVAVAEGDKTATKLVKEKTSESWITSINVADPEDIYRADQLSFPGEGNVIQATSSAIYVASTSWQWQSSTTTNITYVDISDPDGAMSVRGEIDVKGYVADQYKMDAYDGVLRVVSSAWEDARCVYITTIDLADPDNLSILGETTLEDAVDETLYATRFDGDRAYIVTFYVVDPLFVIDLADPTNPNVAGMLEVPGWSTHIEPQGDLLIALGVDDSDSQRRVCVSLFDVADPAAPTLVDRVSFGDQWTWSSAYSDVKAFTVQDDLLIVPFSGWTDDFGGYDRLQFIGYSSEQLDLGGYVDVDGTVRRSIEYDGSHFAVTTEQLVTIDAAHLAEPSVTHRLPLAENVADFLEISPSLEATIITHYDTGITEVRTGAVGGKALGTVRIELGEFVDAYTYGDTVVLVGAVWRWSPVDWTDQSCYVVAFVECSSPAQPFVTKTLEVDVTPFSGVYPLYYYDGLLLGGVIDSLSLSGWWYPSRADKTSFLLGQTLALRCSTDKFDATVGGDAAYQGLALVDLEAESLSSLLGLAYNDLVSVDQAGEKLYLGTQESAGWDTFRPLCAYFLRELDVNGSISVGPAANVPGAFIDYDADTDVLTVRDYQWRRDEVTTSLRTVAWNGSGPVEPIEAVVLPTGAGQILGRDGYVYLDVYDDGYHLAAARITPSGAIDIRGPVLVSNEWGSLVDAQGGYAYVIVGGGALASYDFTETPELSEVIPVMGSPSKMRFGTEHVYAPMGYFGLVTLDYPE